jgi:hypothetical protein
MLSGEATYANCIVFGLTRPGPEPSVYCTRDEHAYHYATDVVQLYWYIKFIVIFIHKHIAVFILFCSVWEMKFDKDSLGRLSKNQAKHLIWIVIYCLANIYVEYFEKLIQGPVLKYLSIYFIVWVWEHKYNMYANIIKLIWVETQSNRGSPFSVFCQTDYIICRFEWKF